MLDAHIRVLSTTHAETSTYQTPDPGPRTPDPWDPGPLDPGPFDPGPLDPGPGTPDPWDPGPLDPGPWTPDRGPRTLGPGTPYRFATLCPTHTVTPSIPNSALSMAVASCTRS